MKRSRKVEKELNRMNCDRVQQLYLAVHVQRIEIGEWKIGQGI